MLHFRGDQVSELKSQIEYGKFLDSILKFDKKIRFVAIYNGSLKAKFRNQIQNQFKEKEIKYSLSGALKLHSFSNNMKFNLKEPKFTMTHYDKINQITIPIDKEGVILLTTEMNVDIHKLVNRIIEYYKLFHC